MNRGAFLASASVVAASVATPALADGVPGGTHLVEPLTDFDQVGFVKIVDRPSDIREMFEAVAFKPSVWNNVKNAFNGLQFGYGYPADRIAIVFAGHGPSSAFTYTDYVWSKYHIGEMFSLKNDAGEPIVSNTFYAAKSTFDPKADPNDEHGMYQDTAIATLQRRGVTVLTCHTAVEEQARAIVKRGLAPAGMTGPDVANDILTHLIPGAVVVPAMVATVAVLQTKYRYAYLTLAM
jgi:intracellular sulfur oxidation DsrE/DsrF family protein